MDRGVQVQKNTLNTDRIKKEEEGSRLRLSSLGLALALGRLARQELGVDEGDDTSLRDDDVSEKSVQLFIVTDGELKMPGNDTLLLVIASGVTGEFENFCGEVLEDGSEVDRSTSTNTLSIVATLEKTVDTTDRELEASLC